MDTVHEGNIARQKFLHNRKLQDNKFNLLDTAYLKNNKPRIRVSKMLNRKPEGRGITKVVNTSNLKKATGPFYREKVETKIGCDKVYQGSNWKVSELREDSRRTE